MKKVILASKSPRRTELFAKYGIIAKSIPADINETIPNDIKEPCNIVKYLSEKKAACVAKKCCAGEIVVAADTLVFKDGRILGKPGSKDEAREMMKLLSGSSHSVISGICVVCNDKKVCESVETKVVFRTLSCDEIEGYISTAEPYDKAGGYGIQALAGAFVSEIHGDYYNVVGLPVSRLLEILKNEFDYDALSLLFEENNEKTGK